MCSNLPSTGTEVLTIGGNTPHLHSYITNVEIYKLSLDKFMIIQPERFSLDNVVEAARCIQPSWIFEHPLLRYARISHAPQA